MDMQKRNYGIDLLRIISMILVVMLHVLGQGGLLSGFSPSSLNYKMVWFFEVAAFCATNCYALISGYVGVRTKHRYANIMSLCLEVIFYTLLIALVFKYYMPDTLSDGVFFRALFPFVYNHYWYFTAYFCIFFFMPFFNKMLLSLNRRELKLLALTIFALFTVFPTLFGTDMFSLGWGYTPLWIGALYLFGGCLRLLDFSECSKCLCICVYGLCVVLSWVNKFYLPYPKDAFLINYISPTMLLGAAALVVLFSKLNPGKWLTRIIAFFAPLTFGVFLIHTHPLIWNNWLLGRYVEFCGYSTAKIAIAVFVATFAIWFICSIFDWIRYNIFRLLKIKKIFILLENKIRAEKK